MKNKKSQTSIFKKIKLIITDIDGVLTDGGMYYSENGEILKKFHTRDGMAVELLLNKNIKTVFLTKEKSNIIKKRAKKIKVSHSYLGITNKELTLPRICTKFSVKPTEIAYIGDDVNDLKLMKLVGFSASPADAVTEIQKISDYKCKAKGGEGVLREVADLILSTRQIHKN